MEAARPVFGDESVGDVDKAIDEIRVSSREIDAEQDGLKLGRIREKRVGNSGKVAPGNRDGDLLVLLDERGQTPRDGLCFQ